MLLYFNACEYKTHTEKVMSRPFQMPRFSDLDKLIYFNRTAAFMHLVFFIVIFFYTKRQQQYQLHMDSTFYSTVSLPSIYSAQVGSVQTNNGIICDLAEANYFKPSGDVLSLQMTSYPRRVEPSIEPLSLNFLIWFFFLLSFLFQGPLLEYFGSVVSLLDRRNENKKSHVRHLYHRMFNDPEKTNEFITINILRYIEYSISASVMMIAISLLSGNFNAESVAYIATLCFTCMLLGWIAEFCFRISMILENPETASKMDPLLSESGEMGLKKRPSGSQNNTPLPRDLPRMCRFIAYMSHALGWICLLVPWSFIIQRYSALFVVSGGCDARSSTTMTPPSWLMFVFVGQGFLFLAFGFVQIYQFNRPSNRMRAEFAYITLSLLAKSILGLTVSANLFM